MSERHSYLPALGALALDFAVRLRGRWGQAACLLFPYHLRAPSGHKVKLSSERGPRGLLGRKRLVVVERYSLDLQRAGPQGHNDKVLLPQALDCQERATSSRSRKISRVAPVREIPLSTNGHFEIEKRLLAPVLIPSES